ncbi:MAG: hypothetical protein M1840_000286 [Geoglossum simile]|nr:MAG: hypothetical protein M1840_000286 [Geoglossum simile]
MSANFLADLFLLQRVPEPGAALKPASFSAPQVSPASTLYVPHSPLLGRPPALSPEVERELREACAEIVKNFKPSGYEFMDLPQARARRACNRVTHKPSTREKSVPEPQPQFAKKRPSGIFPRFRRGSTASGFLEASQGPTYQHVPSNAATSFANTTTVRKPSISGRRASCDQSNDTRTSTQTHTVVRQASLNTLSARPHTASGILDLNSNSSSTTRTNTTWDRADMSRSTSATTTASHNHTPPDNVAQLEGKCNVPDTSGADAAATAWVARELSKRLSGTERPPSRSSRIVNYLRPRPSMESVRDVQLANPPSGINWWNGNTVPRSPDPPKTDKPDPLDLNRALPPLPSLSTWNPNTTGPNHTSFTSGSKGVHVAHLMRGSSTAGRPPATVVDSSGMERVISRAEERQRDKDLRRLVEEKMKGGSIVSPVVSPGTIKARQKSVRAEEKQQRKGDSTRIKPLKLPSKPLKHTTREELKVTAGPGEKKIGSLRRQLNRLALGGILSSRQRREDRKAYGKVIEEDSVEREKRVLRV